MAVLLLVGGETCVQAARNSPIAILSERLDELAVGEFGVQSPAASTKRKKEQTTARDVCSFLVEVAGLELAASSTRNWRATTCATPRFFDDGIIAHFGWFVKGF